MTVRTSTLRDVAIEGLRLNIIKICADHGLDATRISYYGVSEEGYFEIDPDQLSEKLWRPWPENFPILALLTMYEDINWMMGRS